MKQNNIPFNDEFVSGKLEALKALGIGHHIITEVQMQKVREILEIQNDSFMELQAKRNSVVKLLTENDHDEKAWDTMSGVTFVLDSRLWDLTGNI